VGVQPFGGEGLSGTGPKAGGPLYVHRLLAMGSAPRLELHSPVTLAGPTGERNTYCVEPRGTVLCIAATEQGAKAQWMVTQATGNRVLWQDTPAARAWIAGLPAAERGTQAVIASDAIDQHDDIDAVLFEGDGDALRALNQRISRRAGPILPVLGLTSDDIASGRACYAPERLVLERSVSINTAAAGGNASLMTVG